MRRPMVRLTHVVFLAALALSGAASALETRWHLAEGVLGMWAIEVVPLDPSSAKAFVDPALPHYRSWRSAAQPGSRDGLWTLPGLRLRRGDHEIVLEQIHLELDPARAGVTVSDAAGRPWLIADLAHQMPGLELDWRHLSLRPLPALARALGEPALEHVVLGSLALRGGPNLSAKGAGDCTAGGNWPAPGQPADIALTALGTVAGFASRDCSGGSCVQPSPAGSTAGEVVLAPDALLVNVGERDVAWYTKFYPLNAQQTSPPDLPYPVDQHPYLVWALYREEADGTLVPLGSSGVKHAFFAQNSGCGCRGDYVLFPGCGDLYSAATNDLASLLGPRREIDPRSGRWGRCGSVFDPDCNGMQDFSGYAQPFERRLLAAESELITSAHPGARWFIEAWYVVRDDGNIDNSMAHREIVPAKSGSGWLFPTSGELVAGPVINRWVPPAGNTTTEASQRLDLPEGRLQMAVKVDELGSCRYRYRYSLMNLDYADSEFSGSDPNLRMLSSIGIRGLAFAVDARSVSGLRFRDDDRQAGNDWTASSSGALILSAPAGGDLGWGRLATLEFESDLPPGQGPVEVSLGQSDSASFTLPAPTTNGERAHCDGFEQR
ncbi:hypothetical protein [Pseudomarimonas salicorniae]|uniref:Uncharacterized protein n=1 Tax=Pseudomarimonas salicorniae TaxID=2933270 RepID=A0ABT0GHJ6_9GAMM|nr:hypothetical protein [Lysobacter sp. CAU 1642]MCK7594021.1 hypothetical protein [Lysobacter sp. CAU 1642]